MRPHPSNEKYEFLLITEQISKTLRRMRLNRLLKQKDLAKQLGISQAMVSYLEHGRKKPPIQILFKAGRFFDIKISDLLINSNPTIQAYDATEIKDSSELAPGVAITEKALLPEETWLIDVSKYHQLYVRLRIGEILIHAPHLKEFKILQNDKVILVPGGGHIRFYNYGQTACELMIIETALPEGRTYGHF